MRVCLGFAAGLMLGIAGMWLLSSRGSHEACAQGAPLGNGDVNGDGALDLGDAIYLLSYLFVDGPKPVPCPAVSSGSVLATGQTTCYGKDGVEIPCDSKDWPGQDGFYRAGCPLEGRLVDNGDGTITDNCTGLMWQQNTADLDGDGDIDKADRAKWQDALKYCEGLVLAGHDDWRLPNIRELESILDYTRCEPAIDPIFGGVPDWYWSSSVRVEDTYWAWNVNFWSGGVFDDTKFASFYVRAVRGGLP